MKKDSLEFYRVKQQIASFCGYEHSKQLIYNEEVQFRYLRVQNLLQQTKEMLSFLQEGETLQFSDMQDATAIYQAIKKKIVVSGKELRLLMTNLVIATRIKQQLYKTSYSALKEYSDTLSDSSTISHFIQSKIDQYGAIKNEASPTLSSIRQQLTHNQSEIERKLRQFIHNNRDILMDDVIVSRNERQCVLVNVSQKNKHHGLIHGESSSGLAVYFEPSSIIELNNNHQTLLEKEENEQYRILKMICDEIAHDIQQYENEYQTLQILDCISAKAKYTQAIDGVIPIIDRNQRGFYFKKAINPLLDLKTGVRNTYELKEKYNTIIISGSNTGGKTVTLKTIGLFVLMAMSGVGLSCEEARLMMFDKLLVDIGDEQSIEQSLSTFSSHMKKLISFTTKVSDKSLILLDELGSGSDPKDSQNLALAFLDYFRQHNAIILVTTHFERIKEYGKVNDHILSASVRFDFEKLQPTYHYVEHQVGQSNAMLIAKKLGVPDSILQLAKTFEQEDPSEDLIQRLDEEYTILNQKREELTKEYQRLEAEEQAQHAKLEAMKVELEQEFTLRRESFNQMLIKQQQEAETILNELKSTTQLPKAHHYNQKLQKLHQSQEVVSEPLKVGDYVEIMSLHYFGTIEQLKGSQVLVNCNGVKLKTKVSDLQKVDKPKEKPIKAHHVSKRSTSQKEVNVIGLTVEQAWVEIDPLLDAALLDNRLSFLIIHGVGTGKLREGIHAKLKKHPAVVRFNLTNNFGATEVYLND